MSEEYRDLFMMQSKWIDRMFTQNETVIKSLIDALNTLSQMRSTSTYCNSQAQAQSPFNLFRNPFAPVNNGSPGLVPLNNIPDPYNFILDNDNGLSNNSNNNDTTIPQQPQPQYPHNPGSFNPFKDMPPDEKNAVLTLFSNLPKIIEQKEKMEKDKEKEDKEWKDKLDRERTG